MAKINVANSGVKVLKVIGSCIVTAAIAEIGYLGGKMLESDVECTVKAVDSKVNPKVMKKRHWYSKPELYNARTKKFVADKTKKTSKKSK